MGQPQNQQSSQKPQREINSGNKVKKSHRNNGESGNAAKIVNEVSPSQKKKQKRKTKNENILCAIIALMKELDKSGLEFVKMDAQKRITKIDQRVNQALALKRKSMQQQMYDAEDDEEEEDDSDYD